MKRFPWFETILIIVVMSISLYAALTDGHNLSWHWFTRDDAYYYFKVAQNISEGHGSTFDGINPTNGYHPLWMLICIPVFALARFDLILPLRVLLLVMSGFSVATGILLYRLIGRIFAPPIGAIAALFWVFSYDVLVIIYQQGLESGVAAFFVVLLVYKLYEFEISWRGHPVSNKQLLTLGAIAALTMFSRLDLVFLAGVAGLWIIFRGHLLRFFLPLDIISVVVSALLAFVLRIGFNGYYQSVNLALAMTVLGLIVKLPCAFVFGLYQNSGVSRVGELIKRLIPFAFISSGIVGLLMLAALRLGILEGSFPRVTILWDFAFTIVFLGITRFIFIGLRKDQQASQFDKKPFADLLDHWKAWMTDGLFYYGVLLGSLGIYMIWNKFEFGTFSPVSGQVKRWWASLPGRAYGGSARDILSFFGLSYTTDSNAWHPISTMIGNWAENLYRIHILDTWRYLILLTLFALLFYLILRSNPNKGKNAVAQLGLIPLLSSAWLQVLYYHASGYAAYKEWYWVSQLVIIVLVFSLIFGMLYKFIGRLRYVPIAAWIVAAVIGINMGASFWRTVKDAMSYNLWSVGDPYMDIVPLLEANTGPGSIIGMTGGGNVGYFIHDRTIVNMDGLINSYAYFRALQSRQAGKYLEHIGLDFVLANPDILNQQPYARQFDEYLELLNIRYGGKELMRYRAP